MLNYLNMKKREINIECPFCQKSYSKCFIDLHVASHINHNEKPYHNNESPNKRLCKNTVFETMMQPRQKMKLSFVLQIVDGALIPNININEAQPNFDVQWSCEIKISKRFMSYLGSSISDDSVVMHITTNIPSTIMTNSNTPLPSTNHNNTFIDVAILKSMLQKAFRRGNINSFVYLCIKLAIDAPDHFYRRIPIILLEDGLLHPGYPILIWMMMACSKGYNPPNFLILYYIKIVIEAFLCESYDVLCMDYVNQNANDSTNIQSHNIDLSLLPNSSLRTIIASILLRELYGGMKGDMEMIFGYASLWLKRFDSTTKQSVASNITMVGDYVIDPNTVESINNIYKSTILHREYMTSLITCNEKWGSLFICKMNESIDRFDNAVSVEESNDIIKEINHILNDKNSLFHNNISLKSLISHIHSDLLISEYFIPEGIDFHCDSNLIPHVIHCIHNSESLSKNIASWIGTYNSSIGTDSLLHIENIGEYIKSAIWYFRSSRNIRIVWNQLSEMELDYNQSKNKEKLNEKRKYCGLWQLICPVINQYCKNKLPLVRV